MKPVFFIDYDNTIFSHQTWSIPESSLEALIRLHEDGYSGMLCITNAEAERRALYLEFLKDGRADGAILMEPARDDPHVTGMARHYHLVQCSEYCDNQAVSHVSVDNLAAAREVVLTLAGLGHRRIGFIGADNDFMSTIARRQGYLDGLRVLKIPPREDDQTFAGRDYSFASGVEAARRLLARPERPTALFCISDVLALGAVQAARELGLRVPEDLSAVGFGVRRDGPPQADHRAPALLRAGPDGRGASAHPDSGRAPWTGGLSPPHPH